MMTTEAGSPAAGAEAPYDYIVVGAGAGGGPLAANLADAGMRVLLLEAGIEGGTDGDSRSDSDDYAVPAFHGRASEDPATSWQFFVRHYEDTAQQERDNKYVATRDGVFYPRAAAVGGCTAHNAMITVYPHDADWDDIAALTGDESWRSDVMRDYFERLEACGYRKAPWMRPANQLLAALADRVPWLHDRYRNGGRHGFGGWLCTSLADPRLAVHDKSVLGLLLSAAEGALTDFLRRPLEPFEDFAQGWIDPNDWRVRHVPEGLWQVPLAVRNGRRNGSRERVRDVARRHPDRLVVKTGQLVTRVLIDDVLNAYGVEYVDAPHAYRADPHFTAGALPPIQRALAAREVILAGGAFNTPQLLKLSGIGPRAELERFGIELRVDLPAVGRNLQDRYEVGVVSEMTHDFSLVRGARFRPPAPGEKPDPAYLDWKAGGGIYASNGALAAIIRRSRRELESPDLFVFGLPGQFTGYYPGYSGDLEQHQNIFTWAVLKAHTINRAGEVLLRSADPRDTPHVVFRYFDEGDDRAGEDLTAVVEGVQIARDIMRRAGDLVRREITPGSDVRTPEQLRAWVRDQAWGHHASCTCQMGPAGDPSAVVDSRFRVQGVQRLRIVDASVFPRIPGFFIVTSIYMIAEKASDVVLEDADIQVSSARKVKIMAGPKSQRNDAGYRDTPFWRAYDGLAQAIDHRIGWDRLPKQLGLLVLVGLRNILRQRNLYDTTSLPSTGGAQARPRTPEMLTGRTPDGSYNDLDHPTMGMAGTRFGRNVPLDAGYQESPEELLSPNPRVVSRELLTRREFVPATSLNILAAAWIQFMVKDWLSHGEGDPEHVYELPLTADDPWPQKPLTVLKTLTDPTHPAGSAGPQTFLNQETHWWDASQVYGGGSAPVDKHSRRSGVDGKLLISDDGKLVLPDDPKLNPELVPGWWLGLDMMGTVFVREHNSICDALRRAYPRWTDEELYHRARLINASLIAKIHTAEWTPAIIAHPTTITALHANWWGVAGERVRQIFGRVSNSEVISGIPGTGTEHYGVPYALTEEFTIVYRMHPLIPDDYTFKSVVDDSVLEQQTFRDIAGPHAREVTDRISLANLFYSFGIAHPGALVLNNYPRFLQEFQRPDNNRLMDLAATDILRTRELGVPRYNEFRRLLHLKPARTFEELADNPEIARRLRDIYGDVERVDTIVGMFAEKQPKGFGFSDTAFRVFILMASRRLNSDRFFTKDFTPEMYTPEGLTWVQNTTMIDILLRHYPQLRPALRGVTNAFQPWSQVSS